MQRPERAALATATPDGQRNKDEKRMLAVDRRAYRRQMSLFGLYVVRLGSKS